MKRYRVVLDTNVIVAALRSHTGASHRLLLTLGHPRWQSVVTPALMYEYEDVARRPGNAPGLSAEDISAILDLLYQRSDRHFVYFRWRPLSPDPGDDLVLETAIAGGCEVVVSFNERHLRQGGFKKGGGRPRPRMISVIHSFAGTSRPRPVTLAFLNPPCTCGRPESLGLKCSSRRSY